ncbi:hypothetical protein [Winogradskyella sp.]|uniref:hypothetical protein n=1 Tax=Winogradskyella sp. TaxID=1883156 RepID=UPI003BAA86E7
MMKTKYAIFCLFLTSLIYGQESTLLQNVNYRADELKHRLNTTGDTLVLEGERTIDKVDIFNDDFKKSFVIDDKKTLIPLTNIPDGQFITEVKVKDKLIIMTLIRHKPADNISKDLTTTHIQNISEGQTSIVQNETEGKLLAINTSETLKNTTPKKNVRFYWIINKIHKGHSSRKVMKIGDKETVDKVIKQNEIDLKTKTGRHNELIIWEVYDTSKFMKYKRINPDYANAENVDCFNTIPFYKSGS